MTPASSSAKTKSGEAVLEERGRIALLGGGGGGGGGKERKAVLEGIGRKTLMEGIQKTKTKADHKEEKRNVLL